jgi:hypothetical protein
MFAAWGKALWGSRAAVFPSDDLDSGRGVPGGGHVDGEGRTAAGPRTAARGLTRRNFGITLGSSIVVGAGGLSAVAAAFAAGGAPGSTTLRTAFGEIRLSGAERQARLDGEADPSASGHAGHTVVGTDSPQPVNMTFGDHLMLKVEAFNATNEDILFSAGQLRILADTQPWPVVNRWNDLRGGILPAGGSVAASIAFLVPSDAVRFTALFDDIMDPAAGPAEMDMPPVAWRPGHLEEAHG